MTINLQQRFLLMFADYRQLREENTRLGDEVVSLRGQMDVERQRHDALMHRFCEREVGLNNRLLASRFPVEIMRERKESAPVEPGGKEWKQEKMADFHKRVSEMAAKSA